MSKMLTKQRAEPPGQCSDVIQDLSNESMLPGSSEGRHFVGSLPPENCLFELVGYSPLPLPPHPLWKAVKVCEPAGFCLEPGNCHQPAPFPQLPGPILLLGKASLLALEIAPIHCSDSDWATSLTRWTAVKALTKRLFSFISTHRRKRWHNTKDTTSSRFFRLLRWDYVFYWQGMIFPDIGLNATQASFSRTFQQTFLALLQFLGVKQGPL